MSYITAKYTDIGICKETNQDSMLLLRAKSRGDDLLLAAICDGMGGLSKGELASAAMVRSLARWFSERLPFLLPGGLNEDELNREWASLVMTTNRQLSSYSVRNGLELGTTAVVLLLVNRDYYLLNVGDSRIYLLDDNIRQLTNDQTLVQREMDAGRMTPEEAAENPDRGILLQCIGASNVIVPEFRSGTAGEGTAFLLCCDGFRHEITPEEFFAAFEPSTLVSAEVMNRKLKEMTDLNIQRGEEDNISAILVKIV